MAFLRVALWAALIALATRLVGWWGVPPVAAAAVIVPAAGRTSAGAAALAAALGWGAVSRIVAMSFCEPRG
ncbi:hypothetical protein [Roseisolibacter sp. H3M3-2]|uniref:hypothetical protein n=1 Tax=Roseisolibacter sp. H3M3-2 TaxID=3031323 RepID=UPI0023DAC727|nr:hypothetical protein [Roseisolibacter sp. H3M3-2]MDF1506191.1 hypothetical protein [Roseisolibacter sp. H3M3-2]